MKYLKAIIIIVLIITFHFFSKAQETSILSNHISWNLSDMVFQRLTMEVEKSFGKEKKISVNIPLSVRFGNVDQSFQTGDNYLPFPLNDFTDESDWYIGIGLNFSPTPANYRFRFYLGTEIRLGEATHVNHTDYYDPVSSYYEINEVENRYTHTAFLINVGLKFYPMDNFFMGVKLAPGIYTNHNNNLKTYVSPGLKIGISF